MSRVQRWILAMGLLLMALAALFPPKYHIGHHSSPARDFLYTWYFDSPETIHLQKLVVEWMFLAAATGALMVIARNRAGEGNGTDAKGVVIKE